MANPLITDALNLGKTTTTAPKSNSYPIFPIGSAITYKNVTDESGNVWRVGYDVYGNAVSQEMTPGKTPTGQNSNTRYSGSSSASSRQQYEDLFIDWFGVGGFKKAWLDQALNESWTADDVRRFACANGAAGDGMKMALTTTRQALARAGINSPADSLVMSIISSGLYSQSGLEDYVSTLAGFDWTTSSNGAAFMDYWVQETGTPPTYTAIQAVTAKIRELGWDGAWQWFQTWVHTTESAINGNYGAGKRADINDVLGTYLHRAATDAELDPNNPLWNMSKDALMEYMRTQPEYQILYAGKPSWMSEDAYLAVRPSYDAVYRQIFGIQVPQPTAPDASSGGTTLPTGSGPTTEPPVYTAPAWKNLTAESFIEELAKAGITTTGEGDLKGRSFTDASGNAIAWEDLGSHLPENTFYLDDRGYHYVQEPGAVNPKTGAVTPGPTDVTHLADGADRSNLPTIQGMPPELMRYYINNFISPDEILQQSQWLEDVDYMRDTLNPQLQMALGYGFSDDDLYKIASGAKGSGHLRALILQAQNKLQFREVFRNYTGRDPSAGDYEYLSQNFVSPNEYARVTAAYESATTKLPEINDVLQRVLGKTVTVTDVQDMVLGREGSGATQALINQALKLDSYTWIFKQDQGRNPTPQEYAEFAGYAGPEELSWKITTRERIAENAPVVQELWRNVYNRELTPDELQRLFGDMAGSGDLKAQWKAAQQKLAEREAAESAAQSGGRAITPLAADAKGGFSLAVKPLAPLSMN